jgi:hypothetical protein
MRAVFSATRRSLASATAFSFRAVFDPTFDHGKERMVLADADVLARVPLSAALAHDNVAGETALAAEKLHAQALASRVAPIARRSACLLVSHLGLLRDKCWSNSGL